MKKTIFALLTILFLAGNAFAQHQHFTTSGTILFDKTVNMYAMMQKELNKDNEAFFGPAIEEYKKNHPQFKILKSTLNFSGNKTLFVPIVPENAQGGFFSSPLADQNNTIFTDLESKQVINQKKVFEETFLIKDSTRKIKWKITSETREIAGYTCRRANGLMMDSVYVVAFYTDKIHISGGPESFSGLPGMILGVALPHENVTWFATKVTDTTLPDDAINPPKKGKVVNNTSLKTTLNDVMKNWGDDGPRYLRWFLF